PRTEAARGWFGTETADGLRGPAHGANYALPLQPQELDRAVRKLRVLVLMHPSLIPPESLEGYTEKEIYAWKTEYDVVSTLRKLGHEVALLGLQDELAPLRTVITEWHPHIVFNLLEEFHGLTEFDQHVVSYLELLRIAYTGSNPRGLVLARDKALSKKLLV